MCVAVREAVQAEREHYDDLFDNIKNWCDAYPIAVFPEPDFKKAHEVLKAHGMTLDAISASNMKHVITQVQKMIDAAIRARGNT
jgi:DNA-binding FadR family transcriptional regulator